MQNRAKCKLCQSVIESFHSTDYVLCKCGEIFVDGGESLACGAKNWSNFLRVDDLGNEIEVKVINKNESSLSTSEQEKPKKPELLSMLDEMIKNIENLPDHAKISPINHYDLVSALVLIREIVVCE